MKNPAYRGMTAAALLSLSVTLSGCEYLSAVTFQEDPLSGKTDAQHTSLNIISVPGANLTGTPPISLSEALDRCKNKSEESALATLGVTLIGFGVDALYKYGSKKLESLVDGLKKRSQKTYKATAIIANPKTFANQAQCLVFLRTAKPLDPKAPIDNPNLALIIAVTDVGENAFRLSPVYLKAENAVAITGDKKPVSMSVAFVGKAALKEKGVNKVSVFAEHTFNIPDVTLGTFKKELPQGTGLIALHPDSATQLELVVSITENGSEVPDEDEAKAELKSLLDAVGPTIKDAGKKYLSFD